MDAVGRIEGAAKLTGVFGYWPSFHDAEVLWVRMDRRPALEGVNGPTLEALIHTSEMTGEVGHDGCHVDRHNVLVHFRFHDIVGLILDDFNHQNVLFDLVVADIREPRRERIEFEVTLRSSFGLSGTFQCRQVEVMEVTPCTKDAVPLVE